MLRERRISPQIEDQVKVIPGRPEVIEPDHHSSRTAGRVLAFLFLCSGVATLLSPLLPRPAGFDVDGVVAVGLAATFIGLVSFALPWDRWSIRVSLAGLPIALVLISLHNIAGGADPYRFGLFYLVAFVWVGMFQPRGTAIHFIPLLLPSYIAPLLINGASAVAYASAVYALPIYVMVGEVLAWKTQRLRDLQNRLAFQALHDPLTNLANRRLLLDIMQRSLARAARTGAPIGLLYIDLDGFKQINDSLGHAAGDDLLREVAKILCGLVRAGDVAVRLAGDEFAVLVEGEVTTEGLSALTERIREQVYLLGAGLGVPVGASVGTAISDGFESPEELLRRADVAMYQEKQALTQTAAGPIVSSEAPQPEPMHLAGLRDPESHELEFRPAGS